MLVDHVPTHIRASPTDAMRARAHDLRNLFAVVSAARLLLERSADERTLHMVADGLARVAAEGKALTDALLSGEAEDRACGSDGAAELRALGPLLETLQRPGLQIEVVADASPTWVLMAPAELRAIMLELVTNAEAAGARRIRIRAARHGCRCWLTVGDDGSGFVPRDGPSAARPGLHGTGLHRLAGAVALARGKIRIRSRIGRGSVVAVTLPLIRLLPGTGAEGASPLPGPRPTKEIARGQRSA